MKSGTLAWLFLIGMVLVGVLSGLFPEHKFAFGLVFSGIVVLVAGVRWELEARRNARAWRKEKEANAKREKGRGE